MLRQFPIGARMWLIMKALQALTGVGQAASRGRKRSSTCPRKWLERGFIEQRQATNPPGRGLEWTTLRKVTTAHEES